jgi:hypothetical protein
MVTERVGLVVEETDKEPVLDGLRDVEGLQVQTDGEGHYNDYIVLEVHWSCPCP